MFEFSEYYDHLEEAETCNKSAGPTQAQSGPPRLSQGHRIQSYVIKSAPWTILWFRILGIFSIEYIKRLCVFMFQTCSNSQLLRRVL